MLDMDGTTPRRPGSLRRGHARRTVTRRTAALVAIAGAALVLGGCGSDGNGNGDAVASMRSEERPESTTTEPATTEPAEDDVAEPDTGSSDEFCQVLENFEVADPAAEDPSIAADELRKLGDAAPADLQDDFETLAAAFEKLSGLDESSPEAMAGMFEVFFDPAVLMAGENIEAYAAEECGFELDPNPTDSELPETEPGFDSEEGAAGDIGLEDLDEIEESASAAGATWPDKISSTTIFNDTDVTLTADDAALLTQAEGMAACEAVRAALLPRNPQVVVTIQSGTTTVASAPANQPCAPA
jgi:hypothetical protein